MQAQRARRSRQLSKVEASSQAIPPRDIARTKVAAREPLQFGVLRLMYGFEFGFALAALTDRFRLSFQPLNSFRVEPPEAEPIARPRECAAEISPTDRRRNQVERIAPGIRCIVSPAPAFRPIKPDAKRLTFFAGDRPASIGAPGATPPVWQQLSRQRIDPIGELLGNSRGVEPNDLFRGEHSETR